jgi:hypothetical protein
MMITYRILSQKQMTKKKARRGKSEIILINTILNYGFKFVNFVSRITNTRSAIQPKMYAQQNLLIIT